MNEYLFMACGSGIEDGFNPCVFMSAAVLTALAGWLKKNNLAVNALAFGYIFLYALSIFVFDFTPAQIFVFKNAVVFAAKIMYFGLGVGVFILGIYSLMGWFKEARTPKEAGLPPKEAEKSKPVPLAVFLPALVLSAASGAMASIWPVNSFIMLMGSEAVVRGQWLMSIPLIFSYLFFSLWPLWFVWGYLSLNNVRASSLKIFSALVFFSASSSVILIFK